MELPKLIEKWKQRATNPWHNELERWLLLLEAEEYEDIRKELEAIAVQDPLMKEVFEKWEELSRDKNKWVEYEMRRKAIMDDLAVVREAEIREQKARKEGLAEGRAEGRAEGKAEGRAEGKVEGKAEIAKNMIAAGMSIEQIANLTGISMDEIEKLK